MTSLVTTPCSRRSLLK